LAFCTALEWNDYDEVCLTRVGYDTIRDISETVMEQVDVSVLRIFDVSSHISFSPIIHICPHGPRSKTSINLRATRLL